MTVHRKKLFVSAYACEPDRGSEIGVGWNWVLQMARHFELWVLTRKSNQHAIETWIKTHPETPTIHFVYYDLPHWARFWKKGLRGVRLYYMLWQCFSNHLVKETMIKNEIPIFHHLTYGNALWNVSRYGRKQRFIWGPIGGLETIPAEFTASYNPTQRFTAFVRRMLTKTVRWNPMFVKRCKEASLILCKTEYTRNCIPSQYRDKAILCTDVAAREVPACAIRKEEAPVQLLTVGRLDAWRGFDLILEALKVLVEEGKNLRLTVIGEGIDHQRLRMWATKWKINDHVNWLGRVGQKEYEQQMAQTDIVINAALKEAAVTVSFDAISFGKPLVAMDSKGFTRLLTADYARVVPIHHREQVITDLCIALRELSNPELRKSMRAAALQAATRLSWDEKGKEIARLIQSVC